MAAILTADDLYNTWKRERDHHLEQTREVVSRETAWRNIPIEWISSISLEAPELWKGLEAHCTLVLRENQKINLVSRKSPEEQIRDNAFDGILLGLILYHVSRETEQRNLLLDAGSGSGVPGIPALLAMRALDPSRPYELVMIDANIKKQDFLARLIRELKLEHAHIFRGRLENPRLSTFCRDNWNDYRWTLCTKALAGLDQTLKWCRLIKDELAELQMIKGPAIIDEIQKSRYLGSNWKSDSLYRFQYTRRETYLLGVSPQA